jgi:hypothetical protein
MAEKEKVFDEFKTQMRYRVKVNNNTLEIWRMDLNRHIEAMFTRVNLNHFAK